MTDITSPKSKEQKPSYLLHRDFTPKTVEYGFFTRAGGVSADSKGIVQDNGKDTVVNSAYTSLNAGIATDDSREHIARNIRIAYEKIAHETGKPLENAWLFMTEAMYSNKVIAIRDEDIEALKESHKFSAESGLSGLNSFCTRIKADGFVTNSDKVVLSTVSADAHSIVLVDEKSGVVGIMAGSWKGLAKGLFENVVQSMQELGAKAENIVTVIGPGLAQENYEFSRKDAENTFYGVDVAVDASDLDKDGNPAAYKKNPEYRQFFPDKPGVQDKCLFDMPGLVAHKAESLGLKKENVLDLGVDTMLDARVYGARRDSRMLENLRTEPGQNSALHKIVTGRNLNFATLIQKQREAGETSHTLGSP